jgi:transposase
MGMRRVIGIDVHRTFGEAVIWEDGILRHLGRVDMTRTALEGLGKSLRSTDEVVIEATGNSMAVPRVLTPFVARVIIANPLQGEGHRSGTRQDRQDRRRHAGEPACGWVSAADLDA